MPSIDSYFLTDPGQKRANNEDAVGAFEPKDSRQLRRSGRLYVVADGLGGHQMGEWASKHAVDTLLELYYEAPHIPPEKRLQDIIQRIHQDLIAFARRNVGSGEKVATTIAAAVVRNDTLLVAHVGDSRAYLLRGGELHQLTRDHSFVGEMMRAGALTEEEAQQSRFRNRLTRSLGGSEAGLEVDVSAPIPLQPGDLILLCTDGLTQYATSQDLLAAASYGTPRQIVERLVNLANTRGGSDNITALVVKYGKPSLLPASLPSWKTLAAVGAGVLTLAILALLGWFALKTLPAFRAPTATPTALPTPTATLTPEPTATFTPIPSETPSLDASIPALPSPGALIDCNYEVQPGDSVSVILLRFQVTLEQIFFGEERIPDPEHIEAGWTLTIKGVLESVCLDGGGVPR